MTIDTGIKLLIVDDLPENLLALEASIRDDGYSIHQASSGEQALALLLEHEFALAILDVQMPGMNGFELAELIRGMARTKHLPIVFVSAAGLVGMRVAGGLTIVQDPASAEVSTMPDAALRRMTPDLILPLAEIHSVLLKLGEPK